MSDEDVSFVWGIIKQNPTRSLNGWHTSCDSAQNRSCILTKANVFIRWHNLAYNKKEQAQ